MEPDAFDDLKDFLLLEKEIVKDEGRRSITGASLSRRDFNALCVIIESNEGISFPMSPINFNTHGHDHFFSVMVKIESSCDIDYIISNLDRYYEVANL